MKFPGLKMSENKIVAIVSPPYEEDVPFVSCGTFFFILVLTYLTRIAFKSLFL